MTFNWQTWLGFDNIFFDCDSTLSTIEGIDELARNKGKYDEVKRLTDAAMEGEVHLQSVYDLRLTLLKPTRAEVRELERHYRETLVADAADVIQALLHVGKMVYIVSGGLLAAVRPFGMSLGLPPQNIRAVDLRFNDLSGSWWDYQQDQWGPRPDVEYLNPEQTPLIQTEGKAAVVKELLGTQPGRAMLIGDGVSDLAARPAVDMVIGFGGVIARPRVAVEADIFITAPSLAAILPLALTEAQGATLQDSPYFATLQKGLSQIESNEVNFNYVVRGVS